MREIKFRAWAYASRKMFYPDTDDGWEIKNGKLSTIPNTFLMQFTGLKDKNGKEIYEGDIVDCTGETVYLLSGEKTGEIRTTLYQIIWFEDAWGTKILQGIESNVGKSYKGITSLNLYGEVIGNIHENPELMEVKE